MKPMVLAFALVSVSGLVGLLSTKRSEPQNDKDFNDDIIRIIQAGIEGDTPAPPDSSDPPAPSSTTPSPRTPPPGRKNPVPSPPPAATGKWKCKWEAPPKSGRCRTVEQQRKAHAAFTAFTISKEGMASREEAEDVVCRGECVAVFRMNDPVDMLAKAVEGNGKETSIFMIGDSTVRKLFEKIESELPNRVKEKDTHTTIPYGYVKRREFRMKHPIHLSFTWSPSLMMRNKTLSKALDSLPAKPDIAILASGVWALWKPTYERALLLACTFRSVAPHALTSLAEHSKQLYVMGPDSLCAQNLKKNFFDAMPNRKSICKKKDICKEALRLETKNDYEPTASLWKKWHGGSSPDCLSCREACEKATFTAEGSAYLSKHLRSAFNEVKAPNSHFVDMTALTRNAGCKDCADGLHHEGQVLSTKLSLLVHHIFINSDLKPPAGKALYKWQ